MKISLNENSWHARYYKWAFDIDKPKSLCPYFWIMFVLCLISPFMFISWLTTKNKKKLPNTKEELYQFQRESLKRAQNHEKIGKWISGFILILVIAAFVFMIIGAIKEGILLYMLLIFGIVIIFIIAICALYLFIRSINWKSLKLIQVIGAMLKAIYTKTCPLIEWKTVSKENIVIDEILKEDHRFN